MALFCVSHRRAAETQSCRRSWGGGRRGSTLAAKTEPAGSCARLLPLVALKPRLLLKSIHSRTYWNVEYIFNCIFIFSQYVCNQVFILSNYVACFFLYCPMRFCWLNICTVLCVCARMCMHNKHVTYIFLQAVRLMFILIVNIADVYSMTW